MEDGILLESVEGLEESLPIATTSEMWESLQGEREAVARELLASSLVHAELGGRPERDPADEVTQEIEWLRRAQLEARTREVIEAQDRLCDGVYGRCSDCGEQIEIKRLVANPAAARCVYCQTLADLNYQPNYRIANYATL